jgi:neutral trehalase
MRTMCPSAKVPARAAVRDDDSLGLAWEGANGWSEIANVKTAGLIGVGTTAVASGVAADWPRPRRRTTREGQELVLAARRRTVAPTGRCQETYARLVREWPNTMLR